MGRRAARRASVAGTVVALLVAGQLRPASAELWTGVRLGRPILELFEQALVAG